MKDSLKELKYWLVNGHTTTYLLSTLILGFSYYSIPDKTMSVSEGLNFIIDSKIHLVYTILWGILLAIHLYRVISLDTKVIRKTISSEGELHKN